MNSTILLILIPIVFTISSCSTSDSVVDTVNSETITKENATSTDPTIVNATVTHRRGNPLRVLATDSAGLAKNFFLGNSTGLQRIHRERIEYLPIPWMRREKVFDFEDPKHRNIKAIYCYDYKRTEAEVDLLHGGLGFPFVSLLFTSAPSYGLDFAIEIFA